MPCLFLPFGLPLVALVLMVVLSAVRTWRRLRRWLGWRLIGDRLGCLTLLPPSDTTPALGPLPLLTATDSTFAVWLSWRRPSLARGRDGMLLLPDQMTTDDWRALRLWLRQRAGRPAAEGV